MDHNFHRMLDYLLVGSVQDVHIAALPRIIERYPPSGVIWAGREQVSSSAYYLHERLIEIGVPITLAEPGLVFDPGEGAELRVVAAGRHAAVYLLKWGRFRVILPIGPSYDDFEGFGYRREIRQVTVLLLGDSGYGPTNPLEWIDNLLPQTVVLRTDRSAWVKITTDSERMWVEVER